MKKYITSLNGKKYLISEVVLWPNSKLTKNFDPKSRDKMSKSAIIRTSDPVWREQNKLSNILRAKDPEFRAQQRKTSLMYWADPKFRAKQAAGVKRAKAKIAAKARLRWADPEYKARVVAKVKATIAERSLDPNYTKSRVSKWRKSMALKKKPKAD